MDTEQVQRLARLMEHSRRMVFFGGAGVSTESGIPDFRSASGLYHLPRSLEQADETAPVWAAYLPEEILSHHFFTENPEAFFAFYRSHMIYAQAQPNQAHRCLADLEKQGRLEAIITQNIDGLHQDAGSRQVLELHGSVRRNTCLRCHRTFGLADILDQPGVPHCPCGGLIKPDVVLYEESLDERVLAQSVQALRRADLLLIGGTSLRVYPAAGLIDYYTGGPTVLINRTETPLDGQVTLAIHGSIGEVLAAACSPSMI
jgi:NAD-dependent deacetylase